MGLGDSEFNVARQDGSQTPTPQDSESRVLHLAPWGQAVLLGGARPGHGPHRTAGRSRAPPEADVMGLPVGRIGAASPSSWRGLGKWVRPWEERSVFSFSSGPHSLIPSFNIYRAATWRQPLGGRRRTRAVGERAARPGPQGARSLERKQYGNECEWRCHLGRGRPPHCLSGRGRRADDNSSLPTWRPEAFAGRGAGEGPPGRGNSGVGRAVEVWQVWQGGLRPAGACTGSGARAGIVARPQG